MSSKKCQVRVSSKSVKQGCPTRVSPQCVNSGCLTSEFAGNVTNKYCLCLSTYVSAFGFVGFILFFFTFFWAKNFDTTLGVFLMVPAFRKYFTYDTYDPRTWVTLGDLETCLKTVPGGDVNPWVGASDLWEANKLTLGFEAPSQNDVFGFRAPKTPAFCRQLFL